MGCLSPSPGFVRVFRLGRQNRTTLVLGAGLFLVAIALLPLVLTRLSGLTAYFLGGTGVLILTGVLWDAYRRARMDLPCVGVYRLLYITMASW